MIPPRRSSLLLLLFLLAAASPAAVGQRVEVEPFVLDNGMTFLLLPRHEEPNTVSCGWVAKVGSVNERPGITGISHFFEHMMFKGTSAIGTRDPEADARFRARLKEIKERLNELVWEGQYERYRRGEIDDPWDPDHDTEDMRTLRRELEQLMAEHRQVIVKNEFSKVYSNAGGTGMNAFTSQDMTFYFISVPGNKVELWAWMESDRLHDSVFREFYSERDVVHEERRMGLESSPTGELDEQFDAMFWQSSPYSWSVVGWPSDLNSYTREDFDRYFGIYYRPNNLVGVLVGDFDPAAVKPILREYFGRLERGEKDPPPVVTLEVDQVGEKRLIGECDCPDQVKVQYHTVPFNHADSFALDVMTGILNGRTGRLYKSMVEGLEIAANASVRQDGMKHAGAFVFAAEVKGDATPDDLERAWYAELERLRTEPVPERELQKVKNQIAADAYRRLQSNTALLFQLGMYEALGDWRYINESPARLAAVTADDLMRVANAYFARDDRNVAIYTRRAGTADADDPLAALSTEERAQVEAQLAQILAIDDIERLRLVRTQMEAGRAAVPEDYRPVLQYMLDKVSERIATIEAEDGS